MKQAIENMPVELESPHDVILRQTEFVDVTNYSEISVESMQLAAGTDLTPLFEGVQDDRFPCPHWGYVLDDAVNVGYTDGTEEAEKTGDLFYLPPGHTASVDENAEFIMFSSLHEHTEVLEHMADKMGE